SSERLLLNLNLHTQNPEESDRFYLVRLVRQTLKFVKDFFGNDDKTRNEMPVVYKPESPYRLNLRQFHHYTVPQTHSMFYNTIYDKLTTINLHSHQCKTIV